MIDVISQDTVTSYASIKEAQAQAEKISWLTNQSVTIRYPDGSTQTVKIDA